MSKAQVAFLCGAASSLPRENNQHLTVLKSYYLMRCQEITKGHGLPEKQFSSKVRCGKCCITWNRGTEVRVSSILLSKRQIRRIQYQKPIKGNKNYVKKRKEVLHGKQMEQICLFCKHSTLTIVSKPERIKDQTPTGTDVPKKVDKIEELAANKTNSKKIKPKKVKPDSEKSEVNVYSEAKDVFSLKHKKNTITSAVKQEPKVIKNSKRKKDKFAGLCQKAVLASVKLKEEKQAQNKLNLFLKPSSE